MNQEQFRGNWNQLKGDLKKQWGNFTDDALLEVDGDQDTFHGAIQKRYGAIKEEVSQWVDQWYAGHGAPNRLSWSIKDAFAVTWGPFRRDHDHQDQTIRTTEVTPCP